MSDLVSLYAPIDRLLVNPQQPREEFDEAALNSLAESIKEHDIIQALSVEDAGNGWYIIHDGERRWRDAKIAGLTVVPCVVSPSLNGTADRDRLLRALIANDQREELNPIEQAKSYQSLRQMGLKMYEIVQKTGRKDTFINMRLRLLLLDEEIQTLVAKGFLPRDVRIVDAFLSLPDKEVRVKLATQLARMRRVGITAVVNACKRLKERLEEQTQAQVTQTTEKTPAFVATKRPSATDKTVRWPLVRAAAQGACDGCDVNPRLPDAPEPAWSLIVAATETTCTQCNVRPRNLADTLAVCRACPMVEMLGRLVASERK